MRIEGEDKVQLEALREDICTVCKYLGLVGEIIFFFLSV